VRNAIIIVIRWFVHVHVPGILAVVNMEMPGERIMIVQRTADGDGRVRHRTIRCRDLRNDDHRSLRSKRQGRRQHERAGDPPKLPMQSRSHGQGF